MKINLKNVKPHSWVSIVMVLLVIVNSVLTAMGKPVIEFQEDQITAIVTVIMDLVFIGFAVYKNQSITEFAQIADEILYMLRDGRISKDEVMTFIANHKNPERPTDEPVENSETIEDNNMNK